MNQNFLWKSNPFLRILIDAIIGIAGYIIFQKFNPQIWLVVISIFVVLVVWQKGNPVFRFRWHKVRGFLVHLQLILMMYGYTYTFWSGTHLHHFSRYPNASFLLKIDLQKGENNRWVNYEAEVLGVIDSNQVVLSTSGKCLLHLPKKSSQPKLGDVIYTRNSFFNIKPIDGPSNFDYPKYLASQNIRQEFYLHESEFMQTGINKTNSLHKIASYVQDWVENFINQNITISQHKDMLYALLLGDKKHLQSDLKNSFSETGTIHVLAISGLHLGIIFLFIQLLFQPIRRYKIGNWIQTIITISILWLFALITGFSPSVCRSATMFSLFAIGALLDRRKSSINLWATTCFVLLMINPLNLVNVGFQFSFLAVGGILVWHRPLRQLFHVRWWFLSKIIDLITLSFCAQMAILPLSVYYFHQFPIYFLLSNLIIVPCITVVMYTTLMGIIIYFIPIISNLFLFVCEAYLWFLIEVTKKIQSMPFGLIQDWFIHLPNMLFMYAGIIGFIGFACYKTKITYRLMMYAGVAAISYFLIDKQSNLKQQMLCNLKIDKKEIPAIIRGNRCTLLTQKTETYSDMIPSHKDWLKMNGIKHLDQMKVSNQFLINFGNQKILFVHDNKNSSALIQEHQPSVIYQNHKFWMLKTSVNQVNSMLKIPWANEVYSFEELISPNKAKWFVNNRSPTP